MSEGTFCRVEAHIPMRIIRDAELIRSPWPDLAEFRTRHYITGKNEEDQKIEMKNKMNATIKISQNYTCVDNLLKFVWRLTNENSNILHKIGQYLHDHFD